MYRKDKHYIKNADEAELQDQIVNLKNATDANRFENCMFERFLKNAGIEINESKIDDLHDKIEDRKITKKGVSNAERIIRLTDEQKTQVAIAEVEFYKHEILKLIKTSEKVLDHYRALIEESELRKKENIQQQSEFSKKVLKVTPSSDLHEFDLKTLMRYFGDLTKKVDAKLSKLSLKNTVLRGQLKRLMEQLRQKEEMGEFMHAIDHEQLKIQSRQALTTFGFKNREVQQSKLLAGRIKYKLNTYKNDLHLSLNEKETIESDLCKKNEAKQMIDREIKQLQDEISKEAVVIENIREERDTYRVPPVMDYILAKRSERELSRIEASQKRKKDIAQMNWKTSMMRFSQLIPKEHAGIRNQSIRTLEEMTGSKETEY